MIHLCYPFITEAMRKGVAETLNTRWIGEGPKVVQLEQAFQKELHTDTPVAVGSGTDALHLAYILAGVGPGDEVIAPVFTCTATNFPILWQGAKIVFADIEPNTLNIDPYDVYKKITKRTKAIVGVDYAGLPCDWKHITQRLTRIKTIDDAAHAPGAPGIGSQADFTTFSFQAIKHITTGDGGMLCIKDNDLVAKAKRLRWFGLDREKKLHDMKHWEGDITEVGYKYQMTDIAASMGIESLKELRNQIIYRKELVKLYHQGLAEIEQVKLLDYSDDSAHWLMTVLVEDREELIDYLAKQEIETSPLHYRNDKYTVFKQYKTDCPVMDELENKILCLPLHMNLSEEDVLKVIETIRDFYAGK